jgi:glycosyltransferase involved in cell wall biosynthesis
MKPLLVFTGPLYSRSGYGECARDFAKYLLTKVTSHEIYFIDTKWGNTPDNAVTDCTDLIDIIVEKTLHEQPTREIDVHFHLSLPSDFRVLGKVNIGLTAGVETTKCPISFIHGCNRMDMVIVPSEFTKETLINTKYTNENTPKPVQCTTEVKVVFEGYDENVYNEDLVYSDTLETEMQCIQDEYCFLFVGHWMTQYSLGNDRKDIGMLIKTFLESFPDETSPPALILKTNGTNFSHIDKSIIVKKINEIQDQVYIRGTKPNIYLLHGDLSPQEMRQLYEHSRVKCHVTFTHGEGFCRPLLESALSGKPIIAPKWSGPLDYLDYKHTLLLPGRSEPTPASAHTDQNYIVPGSEWFVVDYKKASSILHEVYTNYDKYKRKSVKVRESISDKYTLSKMFDEYNKVLGSVLKVE